MRKSGNVLGGGLCSPWWCLKAPTLVVVYYMSTVLFPCVCADDPNIQYSSSHDGIKSQVAFINISYQNHETKVSAKYEGKFGRNSVVAAASGVVVHTVSLENKSGVSKTNNYGCTDYINTKFPSEQWIALVARGDCSFTKKIKMATKQYNATAIVIYNNESSATPQMNTLDNDKGMLDKLIISFTCTCGLLSQVSA